MAPSSSEHLFITIGTSGGVGSGKSTVASIIAEALQGEYINADSIVKDILQLNMVVNMISEKFGAHYLGENGLLNRKALAKDILSEKTKRGQLICPLFVFLLSINNPY